MPQQHHQEVPPKEESTERIENVHHRPEPEVRRPEVVPEKVQPEKTEEQKKAEEKRREKEKRRAEKIKNEPKAQNSKKNEEPVEKSNIFS